MTRILTLGGALSIAVMTASGTVNAAPAYNQNMPSPAFAVQAGYGPTVPWHYEWQYHYNHHSEWVPGWVAVLNR
jgi:hypothetical protein